MQTDKILILGLPSFPCSVGLHNLQEVNCRGQHRGVTGKTTYCNVSITSRHQFKSRPLHFWTKSLLTHLGKQQKLLALGFSLAQPQPSQVFGEWTRGWKPFLSLSSPPTPFLQVLLSFKFFICLFLLFCFFQNCCVELGQFFWMEDTEWV